MVRGARVVAAALFGCVTACGPAGGRAGGPAENPLHGRTIVVDPGHGGTAATDSYRIGPDGEREEWIDLRVALLLRDLLEERGARVVLTRAEDVAVELRARAAVAWAEGADVFISIHHNATADPEANFPIVYYHGYASRNPAGVELGRLVAARLNEKLFGGGAEAVVVSDHVIFPGSGTAVLRHSYGIPGVIGEASFFTNPAEEQRLRDPEHNRREAEAYVLALEEFFSRPLPPVLPTEDGDPLEPFEVAREAERMGEPARRWREDFLEGRRLMEEPGQNLERAYELLTRSARNFPDSPVAREAHLCRAEILERWARTEAAEQEQRRAGELYAGARR